MTRWEGDEVRVELPRVVEAHIRIVGGEVAVTAAPAGAAKVDAEVVSGPPLRVELDQGVLTIVHEPPRWLMGGSMRSTAALVTLTVPAETPLTVRTVSGEVLVAGLAAGSSINTVSGPITATGVSGEVTLRTVSGEVQAEGLDGDLTVNTVSGAVTGSGRVGTLRGRAVSGSLTLDLDAAPDASVSTVSGPFVLRLPADCSMRLDATTMSGHLDSAFSIGSAGTSGTRRLSGKVGDGSGPRVEVRTLSGDVAFLRKEMAGAGASEDGDR
ncbi:MAG TPA: DUF4097 family beta strand repeat-containing protein [Acidimicrobiales bacterium]